MGEKGEGFAGKTMKDIRTKTRGGGWKQGKEAGMAGIVRRSRGKRQKTVLEQ